MPDRVLTDEMLRLNREAAARQNVAAAIHPADFIYWFILDHPQLGPIERATNHYFEDGARSANQLAELATSLGMTAPIKLLEFASGYGCVSRHLKNRPQFDFRSCDIHPEAIEFLQNELKVPTLASSRVPEDFAPAQKFDMVFALSFFSHMPRSSYGRWLKALYNALEPGGYLVFTTHGHKSQEHIHAKLTDGFWFSAGSEQKDLDKAEYGTTVSTPDFVIPELYRQTAGAPIVTFRGGYWWAHQDLWVVKRVPEPLPVN